MISGVYNATNGISMDLAEAFLLNHNGYSPITARLLKESWGEFHEKNLENPNVKLLQICHSQGTIDVKNALKDCPEKIRNRVIVLAIAPAAIVPDELCFNSYNYVSKNDFVYKLEPHSIETNLTKEDNRLRISFSKPPDHRDELIILEPHPEASKFDHSFQSPTYEKAIKDILKLYLEKNGEYSLGKEQ